MMKKKLLLLFVGFVCLYFLVHAAYNLPSIIHGGSLFPSPQQHAHPFFYTLTDIALGYLFVIGPYLSLHRFYPGRKFFVMIALTVSAVGLAFFLNYVFRKNEGSVPLRLRVFFYDNLFFFCVYIVYALVYYFTRFSYYRELQQKELVLQNRQSELSFLRSQVNPHFLFNSLSNIYALVHEGSPHALPAIAGLSELLRYMLYDNNEKVPLEKELVYINKYIELQRLRYEHAVHADLQVSGETAQVQVPPLLLVPFIENAFKHGDFSATGKGLTAIVRCTAGKLYFYCYNTKGKGEKDAAGGIGLSNIKRRLQLLYPGRHLLDIQDNTNSFTVNVEIQYA
ncbi:MAG TPA: histidine kinase [Chitinophagaceae bacterium]|nr:histidine kinase [Chitinophagaceae bacterium]